MTFCRSSNKASSLYRLHIWSLWYPPHLFGLQHRIHFLQYDICRGHCHSQRVLFVIQYFQWFGSFYGIHPHSFTKRTIYLPCDKLSHYNFSHLVCVDKFLFVLAPSCTLLSFDTVFHPKTILTEHNHLLFLQPYRYLRNEDLWIPVKDLTISFYQRDSYRMLLLLLVHR